MQAVLSLFRFFFLGVLTVVLIVFFGLHSVQVAHEHPGATSPHHEATPGEVVYESGVYHAVEQKLILFLLLGILSVFAWLMLSLQFVRRTDDQCRVDFLRGTRLRRKFIFYSTEVPVLFQELYSQGILNPKYH